MFLRWISWEPPAHAFLTFIDFELRLKEFTKARSVFERLLIVHPSPSSYLQYADFEIKQRQPARARSIFERCIEATLETNPDEELMMRFADFEESEGEIERSRAIYKLGLANLSENNTLKIQPAYLQFEKRNGGNYQIEEAVSQKKKIHYQNIIDQNPKDYETWFELTQLLKEHSRFEEARSAYKSSSSHPPVNNFEKAQWVPYVLLVISWAIFEEKTMNNPEEARRIYNDLLTKVPHSKFTISRLWIMYSFFEVRQGEIANARRIFGLSIAQCPRASVFNAYIEMESLLKEYNRVRIIYQKYVSCIPSDIRGWVKYAEFESQQGEIQLARNIFEEAIESKAIESNDLLWSLYIDFESKVGNIDHVRSLFERSLASCPSLPIWKSRIMFESDVCNDVDQARALFSQAEQSLSQDRKDILTLREFRVTFEKEFGDEQSVEQAYNQMPRIEDGKIIFPEDDNPEDLVRMAQQYFQLSSK